MLRTWLYFESRTEQFVDELEVEYEKERGVRMSPILGLSNWAHVAALV